MPTSARSDRPRRARGCGHPRSYRACRRASSTLPSHFVKDTCVLLRITVEQIENESTTKPTPVELRDAMRRLLMDFGFGVAGAENMLPDRSPLLINAETEINLRFPLPREAALAYAMGLCRVVCSSCDVTGRTLVCPDNQHGGGGS